jgi:hypothetical protein
MTAILRCAAPDQLERHSMNMHGFGTGQCDLVHTFFSLLSATAAPSVQAGDTKDSLRDVMDFCNQFVINDPNHGIRLDYRRDCDIYGRDDF